MVLRTCESSEATLCLLQLGLNLTLFQFSSCNLRLLALGGSPAALNLGPSQDTSGPPLLGVFLLPWSRPSGLRMIIINSFCCLIQGFPGGSVGEESTCHAGDLGLIPGLGRSPGEGKGYPLQSSGLRNSMDCIVHGVAKSQTRLSNFHFTDCLIYLFGCAGS